MTSEIFIQAKGQDWGFEFLLDNEAKYNYIHPDCLMFFWIKNPPKTQQECEDRMALANQSLERGLFINASHDDTILSLFNGIVAKKIKRENLKGYNGQIRRCAIVELTFDYDSQSYTETFCVDPSLHPAGVLGSNFCQKLAHRLIPESKKYNNSL